MSRRLRKLRDELPSLGVEALLVTDILNIRYLSGFTGSYAVLLVTEDSAALITDSRYAEQARQECPDFALEVVEDKWLPAAQRLVEELSLACVGFEDNTLCYHDWHQLDSALPSGRMIPVGDALGRLRMVKDETELAAIREAVRIADLAYDEAARILEPGLTEREVALGIDFFMRKAGAEREAFDTIVASGARSALPHAKATDRRISGGELIVLDFGAKWQGYHSDITRTVVLGAADARQEEIYTIVLEAQSRAIAAIRPGLAGKQVDSVAREHVTSAGYGEHFGHGLGHGLGLDVHDGAIVARESDVVLEAGMVVTVEPGIYIPEWGGVRIEDDIFVTESGHEVLSRSPRILGQD